MVKKGDKRVDGRVSCGVSHATLAKSQTGPNRPTVGVALYPPACGPPPPFGPVDFAQELFLKRRLKKKPF